MFTHFSVDEHLGCVLATMNKVLATHEHSCVTFFMDIVFLLSKYLGMEMLIIHPTVLLLRIYPREKKYLHKKDFCRFYLFEREREQERWRSRLARPGVESLMQGAIPGP